MGQWASKLPLWAEILRAFVVFSNGKNGTIGRQIPFKVLPMVPLVMPLVPMVQMLPTYGSKWCRQNTAWGYVWGSPNGKICKSTNGTVGTIFTNGNQKTLNVFLLPMVPLVLVPMVPLVDHMVEFLSY